MEALLEYDRIKVKRGNMKLIKTIIAALMSIACGLILYCSFSPNDPGAGNGSQTPNSKVAIAGILYEPDGQTPAKGATVLIRKKETQRPDTTGSHIAAIDSLITNDSGKFVVDTIDTGIYVMEAGDDAGNVALNEPIVVAHAESTVTVNDTLKAPGAISGTIVLSEGGSPRKVFVLAYGVDRFAVPDTAGKFVFGKLPEGTYRLLIITSLDNYGEIDTAGIRAASDDTTELGTLALPFTGIPTPKNIAATYDTLKNQVTLRWSISNVGLTKGFNVFRRQGTSGAFAQSNSALVTDSTYLDNLTKGLEKGETYHYYVNAVDSNNNAGPNSANVTVVIAYYVDAGKDTAFQIGDSVVLRGRVNTSTFTPAEYRWDVDGDGTNEFVSATEDSARYAYTDTGAYKGVFSVKGSNNAVYADTVMIRIIPKDTAGPPAAPRNVRSSYDTLKQIVTLTWSPNWESDVVGYNVYRRNVDSNTALTRINAQTIADTAYKDSNGMQNLTYEYRIAAVDRGDAEGAKSAAVMARIVSGFELARTIPFGGNDPFRFAVDKDTNFYIANRSPAYVKIINSNGDSIKTIGEGKMSQIYGIALDSKGNIYIADPDRNKILAFNQRGDSILKIDIPKPMDIGIDKSDNIFVVYSDSYKIGKFDTIGTILDSLTLSHQTGRLILDMSGNLYLVDSYSSSVKVYNGTFAATSATSNIPSSMLRAVDQNSNLYFIKYRLIGQSEVDDIVIVNLAGQLISRWGYFIMLTDMKIIDGRIYLLNYNETAWSPQIQIFSTHL